MSPPRQSPKEKKAKIPELVEIAPQEINFGKAKRITNKYIQLPGIVTSGDMYSS
jgi:hypothetical protein